MYLYKILKGVKDVTDKGDSVKNRRQTEKETITTKKCLQTTNS